MELNGWLEVFLGGMAGPIAVEIAKLAQMEKARIPRLYTRAAYWVLSFPLVLLGGVVAIAHGPEMSLLTAMQLGATAPLVVAALASRKPPEASLMPELQRPSGWDLMRW